LKTLTMRALAYLRLEGSPVLSIPNDGRLERIPEDWVGWEWVASAPLAHVLDWSDGCYVPDGCKSWYELCIRFAMLYDDLFDSQPA